MKTQCLQRMLIGLVLALVVVPWALAADRYVATNGTGGGTSWTDTHSNLIAMVALAGDNDTVYVTNNAKYYLTNQITVTNAITVRSWGPGGIYDPTNTIIDANYPNAPTTNRHFTLSNYWATLAGFTLTNGWGSGNTNNTGNAGANGGSIYLYYGTVTNCIITRNYAFNTNASVNSGGGGIIMGIDSAKSGSVWNCTISGNAAYRYGGGILVRDGNWRILNCTIVGNSVQAAGYEGGGIEMCTQSGVAVVSNCWVVSNSAGYGGGLKMVYNAECYSSFIVGNTSTHQGGGIRIGNGSGVIRNCLITYNYSSGGNSWGGGIAASSNPKIQNCTIASNYCAQEGGGLDFSNYDGFPKVENTIIWGNRANANGGINSNYFVSRSNATYAVITFTNCCTSPNIVSTNSVATEVNTITNDPRFVQAATDNYRLQSSSPCINAGVNRDWMEGARDLYGNRRIDNFRKTVDIGAHEYLSQGTMFRGH
ncbi:MAG: hypothetical protein NT011_11375 [Kiritimatiellaeota bacterium]|nr:hypothetical protein [Kiritimatiellota bacterium]